MIRFDLQRNEVQPYRDLFVIGKADGFEELMFTHRFDRTTRLSLRRVEAEDETRVELLRSGSGNAMYVVAVRKYTDAGDRYLISCGCSYCNTKMPLSEDNRRSLKFHLKWAIKFSDPPEYFAHNAKTISRFFEKNLSEEDTC